MDEMIMMTLMGCDMWDVLVMLAPWAGMMRDTGRKGINGNGLNRIEFDFV